MKKISLLLTTIVFFAQQYTSTLAAPSLEACPPDSILVEDTCKCDPSLCSKPPCLSELVVTANGSATPGSCCPVYSCEGCAASALLNGKCPCAPDSILDDSNKCACVDPYKALINGECVCDRDLCPLPDVCEDNSVAVLVQEGCCERTHCVKCPSDSYASNYSDDAVEDMCVCFPCKEKECGVGEMINIIQHGTNFPGKCCDIYECVNRTEKTVCDVKGVVYSDGDNWKTPDGETCYCQNGLSFCSGPTERKASSCILNNITYNHNESWLPDNCTNCTCYDGKPICISHYCEVSEVKVSHCQPLKCNRNCSDGFKVNKLGCPICKCNSPTHRYEDLLHKFNITKNELKSILEDYFARKRNESKTIQTTESISTVVVSTTQESVTNTTYNKQSTTTIVKNDEPGDWTLIVWCVAVPIMLALLIAAVFAAFKLWCSGKNGSYDTNPAASPFIERFKTKKGTLLNHCIIKQ